LLCLSRSTATWVLGSNGKVSAIMNLQRLVLLVGVFGCLSFLQVQAADAADDDAAATADDDNILYWSEYAILPKRCIV
jgi:hypothetical protein